jgi:hypothetical protein
MDNVVRNQNGQSLALIGVALAGIVAVVQSPGRFDIFDAIIGITLLSVLRAYGQPRVPSDLANKAYAALWGLCLLLAVGFVLEIIVHSLIRCNPSYGPIDLFQGLSALVWLGVSVAAHSVRQRVKGT